MNVVQAVVSSTVVRWSVIIYLEIIAAVVTKGLILHQMEEIALVQTLRNPFINACLDGGCVDGGCIRI